MKSVFISSTIDDIEYHTAIDEVLLGLDVNVITMPHFDNKNQDEIEIVLQSISQANIFIGIIGNEYGYTSEGMQKSVIHESYDVAIEQNIPCLMYLIDPNSSNASKIEDKLFHFREVIDDEHIGDFFTTPDDLAKKIEDNLKILISKIDKFVSEPIAYLLPDVDIQVSEELVYKVPEKSENSNWGLYGIITLIIAVIGTILAFFQLPQGQNFLTPQPSPTPLEGEPFNNGEIGVLLADFVTYSDTRRGIERTLGLEFEASSINYIRVNQMIRDRDHARELSSFYNATIVIWGEELSNRIEVNYEITPRNEQIIVTQINNVGASLSDFSDFYSFESYIADGMDSIYVVRYIEGQVAFFNSDYLRAIALFGDAINLIPAGREHEVEVAPLYFYRGNAQGSTDNNELALADYTRAIEIDPTNPSAYNNRGVVYYNKDNYELALEDYNRAIGINPEHIASYFNRGLIYTLYTNDYESAINDYDKVIELSPLFSMAYLNRGTIYLELDNYTEAVNDFRVAIMIDPNYIDAYLSLGDTFRLMGAYDEAVTTYRAALNVDPNFAETYLQLGQAFLASGEHHNAITNYEIAIELDSDLVKAYTGLAISHGLLGNYEIAIGYLEQANEIEPNNNSIYSQLGLANELLGEYEIAIGHYTEAIEIDPNNSLAFNGRGHTYYTLGVNYYHLAIADYEEYERLTGELEPSKIEIITEMQEALANQ